MFPTFTGNSRRARQVNLSGRSLDGTNSKNAPAGGVQNAVAHAHQERLLRQQERERLLAARKIQRVWRGYRSRKSLKTCWRCRWDALFENDRQMPLPSMPNPVATDGTIRTGGDFAADYDTRLLDQLRLLLRFLDVSLEDDLRRLDILAARLLEANQHRVLSDTNLGWKRPSFRLAKSVLDWLAIAKHPSNHTRLNLSLLELLARAIPEDLSSISHRYYQVLSIFTKGYRDDGALEAEDAALVIECLLAPLQAINPKTLDAYEGFIWDYLVTPELETKLGGLKTLTSRLNLRLLFAAIAGRATDPITTPEISDRSHDELLWLLSHVIRFHRDMVGHADASGAPPLSVPDYLGAISALLSPLAQDIADKLDVSGVPHSRRRGNDDDDLPRFVQEQILTLAEQRSVTSLAARNQTPLSADPQKTTGGAGQMDDDMSLLAGYCLTLIRAFPRRSDDIRMWLYLGAGTSSPASGGRASTTPTIKRFWEATRNSEIVRSISREPRNAVGLVKVKVPTAARGHADVGSKVTAIIRMREWRLILLFVELYSFVLKIIDDDEFFSDGEVAQKENGLGSPRAPARESPLPLEYVRELIVFLKNLGFALHWHGAEIDGPNRGQDLDGLRQYLTAGFSTASPQQTDTKVKTADAWVAGVDGLTLDYLKGMVTGLLRMLYERDSRRRFVPAGYWLMIGHFDMDAFIPAVVMEEERRRSVQDVDSEQDEPDADSPPEMESFTSDGVMLAGHTRRLRASEALRSQQQRQSRKKYLEAIAPRLEILENMPFFIPFATRVKIFREFVALDKTRRRGGHVDPDMWRMSVIHDSLVRGSHEGHEIVSKHHAKISRDSPFLDAYESFYELGEGLKEPIQITFVDRFGTTEAGIDGGGVTKEFLTLISKEAFSPSNPLGLFVENDKHLLYPNPGILDLVRLQLPKDASPKDVATRQRESLGFYDFLGRIVGKCMYEGILIDVNFAGFFLVKWALTGGSGVASKESSYRPSLNDLRDLDESLYQGLLQLKNHRGDVADFGLDFTITDTVESASASPEGQTITRELKRGGSNIPVTNENRLIYISYVARHRLQTQQRAQTDAFLRGLGKIIQPSWLSMFNQAELQTLVSGDSSEIDVSDLRRHTEYGGVYVLGDDQQEHPTVQLFWQVMNAFSDADRRQVLKFVTSTPRAPLLGFEQLNPRFTIRDSSADQERLPSTSTCVNLLKLPRYSNANILREKLLYAINSGAGFDLS